jgi:hypothetical protein
VADDVLWHYERGQGWDLEQLRVERSPEDGRLGIYVYADDEAAWIGADLPREAVEDLVRVMTRWLLGETPTTF